MGKIAGPSIQEVLDKTDFLSVYQDRVKLSKKGGKHWGLCPFHTERTPSFSVDAERGLFYCFGCQKGGSIIDFIMEIDKMSFAEAVQELADRAHVKLRFEDGAPPRDESGRTQLYSLYDKLAGAFHWLLTENAAGSAALAVLKKRGIPPSMIEDFRLGYAPASKTWLHRFLVGKGYSEGFLATTGLFSGRSKTFPLFSGRIIFPICDAKGRVIAFGGRLLEGDGPKYINSPDTEIFRKQENLFALDKALPEMRASGEVLVCEGYMDALSFHAAGVKNAVAPLGTAFTARQASLLRRRAEKVLLCFDSDEAGKKAAVRACETSAAAGLEIGVVLMENAKDASQILEENGAGTLQNIAKCAISGWDFLLRRAGELYDVATPEGKAKASVFFYPYADALGSEVQRGAFFETAARRLSIDPISMQSDYHRFRDSKETDRGRQVRAASADVRVPGGARSAESCLMAAVALNPGHFADLKREFSAEDLDDPRARDLYEAMEEAERDGLLDTRRIVELLSDPSTKSFVLSVGASGEFGETAGEVIADGIQSLRAKRLERERVRIISEIAKASEGTGENGNDRNAPEDTSLALLLKKKMQLDGELARIKGEVDERK